MSSLAKSAVGFAALGAHLSGAADVASFTSSRVLFEKTEDNVGEGYRRLLEPMLQFVPATVTCPSSQVHLTLGGTGTNSMTVSWVNPSFVSANTVSYGMDTTMSSSATGTAQTYTQLLVANANLLFPKMGQAGATAAQILALYNTSSFAYDRDAVGRHWNNYKNPKPAEIANPTSPLVSSLGYSNPYAFYDSPMVHTTVLSNLAAGKLYYYKPAGACKTYNFTMTQAVNTYPFKAGLLADLGTTDVSAMSVAVLAAMKANVIVFTGDLSYGKRKHRIT